MKAVECGDEIHHLTVFEVFEDDLSEVVRVAGAGAAPVRERSEGLAQPDRNSCVDGCALQRFPEVVDDRYGDAKTLLEFDGPEVDVGSRKTEVQLGDDPRHETSRRYDEVAKRVRDIGEPESARGVAQRFEGFALTQSAMGGHQPPTRIQNAHEAQIGAADGLAQLVHDSPIYGGPAAEDQFDGTVDLQRIGRSQKPLLRSKPGGTDNEAVARSGKKRR